LHLELERLHRKTAVTPASFQASQIAAAETASHADTSASCLYATHTDDFESYPPFRHSTLQWSLGGTRLLFWSCTVAFI